MFLACAQALLSTCAHSNPSICDVGIYGSQTQSLYSSTESSMTCLASTKQQSSSPELSTPELIITIAVPCFCLTVICTVCAVACYKRAKYTAQQWRRFWQTQSVHTPMDTTVTHSLPHLPHPYSLVMANHYMDIKMLAEANRKDEWEVLPSNLIIHENEVLGNGAFAVVHKATLKGKIPLLIMNPRLNLVSDHDQDDGTCERKEDECPIDADLCLRIKDLVSISWQVSDGLTYLSSKNFIHRDVAARNVLITKYLVAKVSDFGLGRYADSALYTARGGRLPFKSMALEALKFYEFSEKTDVFKLMARCWEADPACRPTFAEIRGELTILLNIDDESYGYLDLDPDKKSRQLRNMINRQVTELHVRNEEDNPALVGEEDESKPIKSSELALEPVLRVDNNLNPEDNMQVVPRLHKQNITDEVTFVNAMLEHLSAEPPPQPSGSQTQRSDRKKDKDKLNQRPGTRTEDSPVGPTNVHLPGAIQSKREDFVLSLEEKVNRKLAEGCAPTR
ncbi:hypothetical protein GCK32_007808 [Trichostrongylus colubriformis]|uniref:Protein kinase domain-containing protein n=1 Tax=Trichostrongylus colubriformis TaxID=6319 RepID=A0AAN8FC76_TRICO